MIFFGWFDGVVYFFIGGGGVGVFFLVCCGDVGDVFCFFGVIDEFVELWILFI